jgi:hypothetical protein
MTETPPPESEPDVATQLRDIGKKYLRVLSLTLDLAVRDLTPRAKGPPRAKPVAKPPTQSKPRTRNLGFLSWVKGPREEEPKG